MLSVAKRIITTMACVAILTVFAVIQAQEVTIDKEFAPLPEHRVFGQPASASDEQAINDLMQRFGKAWSTQDVDGAVAAYAKDAEWVNAFANVLRGHKELHGQFTWLFKRFESNPGTAEKVEEKESKPAMKRGRLSVRYIGDAAAVIHSYTESDWGVNRDGSGELRRVHITYVLEKQQDGQWLIAHQMIMDARR